MCHRRLVVLVFQLVYTTLFGWYASYLFLRTGSILPPILSHIFCNIMGLPPIFQNLFGCFKDGKKLGALSVIYYMTLSLSLFLWRSKNDGLTSCFFFFFFFFFWETSFIVVTISYVIGIAVFVAKFTDWVHL
jgi:hypothetical protein